MALDKQEPVPHEPAHNRANEAAREPRPGLIGEGGAGRPFAPMPIPSSARKRNRQKESSAPRRQGSCKTEIPSNRAHQRVLRDYPVGGHPAGQWREKRIHKRESSHRRTSGTGNVEFLRFGAMINRKSGLKSKAFERSTRPQAAKSHTMVLVGLSTG